MVDYLSVVFADHVDPRRDRVVLGKPFGAQAYYAVLAACGYIEPSWTRYGRSDPNWSYCMSREHPLVRFIDDTMGNALAVACGLALARPGLVYVNAGDAYFQAGTAWESIMLAGHLSISNLLLTIDNNDMQVLGRTSEILSVEPLAERLKSFGWRATSCDGHDLAAIREALEEAYRDTPAPTAVVFNTVKGKGVSFMENNREWHYRPLSREDYEAALRELS